MARNRNRHRGSSERFVALPHWMLRSPAWRSLSPIARCVFLELASIYNGANNGYLALSARDAAGRVGCSKNTAAAALQELMATGFIELGQPGHFDRKTRHAAEYRLTLYECERTRRMASKAFMSWRSDLPKI